MKFFAKSNMYLCICLIHIASFAQSAIDSAALSIPGPANQDASKFATLFIIRPDGDVAKTFWLGFFINDASMVKINNNEKDVIKYPQSGDIEIWCQNEQKVSLMVHSEAGKNYYIQLTMISGGKSGYPQLVQLDNEEGKKAFKKITSESLYVYDPDLFDNSHYVMLHSEKDAYGPLRFSLLYQQDIFFFLNKAAIYSVITINFYRPLLLMLLEYLVWTQKFQMTMNLKVM